MASGPITSWQIDGETMETVSDFIFLGSKITADGIAAMKLKDVGPSMDQNLVVRSQRWESERSKEANIPCVM